MSLDPTPASYRYQEALAPLARRIDDPKVQKKLSEVLVLLDFNSTLVRRYIELTRVAVFYLDPHVCMRCRYRSTELLW